MCGLILFSSLANSGKKFLQRVFTRKLKLKTNKQKYQSWQKQNSYFGPTVWPQGFWSHHLPGNLPDASAFSLPRPKCSDCQLALVLGRGPCPFTSWTYSTGRWVPRQQAMVCFASGAASVISSSPWQPVLFNLIHGHAPGMTSPPTLVLQQSLLLPGCQVFAIPTLISVNFSLSSLTCLKDVPKLEVKEELIHVFIYRGCQLLKQDLSVGHVRSQLRTEVSYFLLSSNSLVFLVMSSDWRNSHFSLIHTAERSAHLI